MPDHSHFTLEHNIARLIDILELGKEAHRLEKIEGKLDLHIASPEGEGHEFMKRVESLEKRINNSYIKQINLGQLMQGTAQILQQLERKIESLETKVQDQDRMLDILERERK
jgi:predicted ribosome quality control (RQC) complex YloA/Tae2 family protein